MPKRAIAQVKLKRAYDTAARSDGHRILVDRLWPRGISRDELRIADWIKEVSPSAELRAWFGHEIADGDSVVGHEKIRRQNNEIETDKEKDGRRQGATKTAQQGRAEAPKQSGYVTFSSHRRRYARPAVVLELMIAVHRPSLTMALAAMQNASRSGDRTLPTGSSVRQQAFQRLAYPFLCLVRSRLRWQFRHR